jgi:outer membrane immunogenic protein
MRQSIFCALVLAGAMAWAAQTSVASAETPDWTGAYAGVAAGAAFGQSAATTFVDCSHYPDVLCWPGVQEDNGAWIGQVGSGSASGIAFLGGAFAGHNWRGGNVVFGVEGDVSAMPLRVAVGGNAVTANEGLVNNGVPSVFNVSVTASTDWIATARARLGFLARPDVLLYATAGVALTELTVSNAFSDNFTSGGTSEGNREASSKSELREVLIIGGGAEWAMTGRWRLRAEYLHTDFGALTTSGLSSFLPNTPVSNRITGTADLHADIVRVGVAYGF